MADPIPDDPVLQLSSPAGGDPGRVVIDLPAPPRGRQNWDLSLGDAILVEARLRVVGGGDPGDIPDMMPPSPKDREDNIDPSLPPIMLTISTGDNLIRAIEGGEYRIGRPTEATPWRATFTAGSDLRNWDRAGFALAVRRHPDDAQKRMIWDSYTWRYDSSAVWRLQRDYGTTPLRGPTRISLSGTAVTWQLAEIRLWLLRDDTWDKPPQPGYENQRLTGREPGLVGYWRVDDGSGTRLRDSSGSGNDGQVEGEATWVRHSEFHLPDPFQPSVNLTAQIRITRRQIDEDDRRIVEINQSIGETNRRRDNLKDAIALFETGKEIKARRIDAAIANIGAEFAAWEKEAKPENTTLQQFVTQVSRELDASGTRINTARKKLRFSSASVEATWIATEAAVAEGKISAVLGDSGPTVVICTMGQHGLETGDRVTLQDIGGDSLAATLNRRDFRIKVPAADRFELYTLAGRPIDGQGFKPAKGGRWRQRDQFRIRFPQMDEDMGKDIARLSRFRFDLEPTPPPDPAPQTPVVLDVTGYTESFARRCLHSAGFRVEFFDVAYGDPARDGQVLSQRPGAGHEHPPDQPVYLFVARQHTPEVTG